MMLAFEVVGQSDASQQTIEDALGVAQTVVEYAGTVAFAISAALLAGRKRMNVVDNPTPWIVAAVAAVVTIPLFKIGTISVMARLCCRAGACTRRWPSYFKCWPARPDRSVPGPRTS